MYVTADVHSCDKRNGARATPAKVLAVRVTMEVFIMCPSDTTLGQETKGQKKSWAKPGVRLYLAYLLTAAFVVTSIFMIARVAFVVGTLALNWHMQPIPGMVVDHAVLADGRAQFHVAATAEPCGVFVVQGANANPNAQLFDGKLGKDRLVVADATYPIMWEATDWTVFPNRDNAGSMSNCQMSQEHGRCVVRTGELGSDVVRAIENGEAFIVVAYNPQDAKPGEVATPLT